jgi:dTDP-glucose 4,6-dehydratase
VRLLVTGGAGFIGSAFIRRRLASTDDKVVVLDKLTYAGGRENIAQVEADPRYQHRFRFVLGDICDAELVRGLADDSDAVVNFAAESHVDRSILDSEAFLRTGVLGLHALLEAVRTCRPPGRRSPRLLQVSTDEVYGPLEEGLAAEEGRLSPRSPYAAAKAAGDLLASAYHATYGLDVLLTRGSNTYGPYQHPEKLIPLFITNAVDDAPLPLYGDGLQRRDWIFVDDHADAIGFVLENGRAGVAYNICAGQEQTNREVTAAILERLGKPWSLVRLVEDRPGHDRRYAMDGRRLADLGWEAKVTFDEGIARTIDWYLANERWWRRLKHGDWTDYYERQYGKRLAESAQA